MIYSVVTQVQQKANTRQACRALQVSRAGYYAARQRARQPAICVASAQVKAAFITNQCCYGSRRIVDELQSQDIAIGRYKVRRLMREAGLKPVWKRKFVNTTDSKHDLPVAENLLNRQFNPPQPNQAWTSDPSTSLRTGITYIRTRTGWLYLAAVMDLHSRKIIGWAMSPSMPAALVCHICGRSHTNTQKQTRTTGKSTRCQERILLTLARVASAARCLRCAESTALRPSRFTFLNVEQTWYI